MEIMNGMTEQRCECFQNWLIFVALKSQNTSFEI